MIDEMLQSGSECLTIYGEHPVVRNDVRVVTGPVREAERAVTAAILHRDPGCYFLGQPRVGKTTTIEMIKSILPQNFPDLPMCDFIAKGHEKASEKNFFGDLLFDLGRTSAKNETAAERRKKLFTHILAKCRTVKSDLIALFIDEGQSWSEFEYQMLRDLINDLRKNRIICVTIIFAHPNLELKVKEALLGKVRTDLTGRFLMTPHTFRGLNSKQEVRDSFDAYDSCRRHQFPNGSGICYSQFFRPQAFRDGWRLGDEADHAWALFAAMSKPAERAPFSLGMQWITGAIRNFIFETCELFPCPPTPDIWERSIRAAAYDAG